MLSNTFLPEHIPAAVTEAEARIRPYILETPLVYSKTLSSPTNAQVYYKLESHQLTASFKVRGAMNKLLSLSKDELAKGVVAASTGNHGCGVAYAASQLGAKGIVFVPENVSNVKAEAIRRYGAELRYYHTDAGKTESHAREFALQNNMPYISPYNDPLIIAGQGTLGLELSRQLPSTDYLYITVGGGGLVAGTAGYLKSVNANLKTIGCAAENDHYMLASIRAGKIVDMDAKPTLSDGSAGGMEADAITFPLVQKVVDDWVTVTEAEIAAAMRSYIETEHALLEGAAGAAIAGFLNHAKSAPAEVAGKNVVIVICGARISLKTLKLVLQEPS
jgi:threonine dehydratase